MTYLQLTSDDIKIAAEQTTGRLPFRIKDVLVNREQFPFEDQPRLMEIFDNDFAPRSKWHFTTARVGTKKFRKSFQFEKSVCRPEKCKKKKRRRPLCDLSYQFFRQRFSAAGVTYVITSKTCLRRLTWLLLVIFTFLLMCFMTYNVLNEYFGYPKIIVQKSAMKDSLEFPAVTVCSLTQIPRFRSKIAGIKHLVDLQKTLIDLKYTKFPVAEKSECSQNPMCQWSWFTNQCHCDASPCDTEFCDYHDNNTCSCSILLCTRDDSELEGGCEMKNSSRGAFCICFKNFVYSRSLKRVYHNPHVTKEIEKLSDPRLGKIIELIRHSKVFHLENEMWVMQPSMHDISSLGTTFDSLIISCSYQNRRCDKRNFTVLYSPTHGRCYMFNYVGENRKDRSTRVLETKRFGGNSGLQLFMQVRRSDVIDLLNREIGVRVVVHDPYQFPSVSEFGLNVKPGDMAAIDVVYSAVSRLGHPWGNCHADGVQLPFNYTEKPYSQLGCQRWCYNYYISKKCNCYRRTYLPSSISMLMQRRMTLCSYLSSQQRECVDKVVKDLEEGIILCNCHPPCREKSFTTSLSSGEVNKEFFRLMKAIKTLTVEDNELAISYASNRTNILGVKVYYRTLTQQTVTEYPAYSWETLVANIGGNLGFFLGLTFITFLEVAEFLWDIFHSLIVKPACKKSQKKKRKEAWERRH